MRAIAVLDDQERQAWASAMNALRHVVGPDPLNESGCSKARQVMTEHRLSRDPNAADPG